MVIIYFKMQQQNQNHINEENKNIKSFFEDLLLHTNISSLFNKIRINLEKDKKVTFECVNEEKTVILNGNFKNKYNWLTSTFGIIDLNRLRSLLAHPNFNIEDKDFSIKISYKEEKNEKIVSEIIFENSRLKTKASHRFCPKELLQEAKFKGVEWDCVFELNLSKINEFISFASIESSRENFFLPKIENNDLMVIFGEENSSNHHLKMCLVENISGSFNKNFYWPTNIFITILKLSNQNKKPIIHLSQKGILMIKLTSDLAEYLYILRAHGK
ncbi:MAG: hypothetical protein NZZ41_05580 [Candidatus Dojkabacteria bacterium]|nr:hypothetical protein [Candidatus Dojkabacteria bacterium]